MKRALIFTAKSTETRAVKEHLLGPLGSPKTAQTYVYNLYKLRSHVNKDDSARDLEIGFYETGRGQEEVMSAVPPIVGHFNPDIVLYIGCAGGDPAQVKVNDVFIPTEVWPYEKGKETTHGFESRAHPLRPTRYLRDMATSIAERPQWRARIPETFQFDSSVTTGGLASGNKVLADEEGEVWNTAKSINDEIVAVETECYGFFRSMEPLHRPYLMIRGISDLLTNKNTAGKNVDDDRQTRATAHAVALATQLILSVDYKILQQQRGMQPPSPYASKLIGFWRSEWHYGAEENEELISIDGIDVVNRVFGRRIFKNTKYEYVYDVAGFLYGDRLHLTAMPADHEMPMSMGLVLKIAGNFTDSLNGIAIRPLGNPPIPKLGRSVLRHADASWASVVEYKRLSNPPSEAPSLWDAYERHR
jgi:nucleoside phosphorylase